MKNRDTNLYLAIFLLIILVVLLFVVTLTRNPSVKIQQLNNQILEIKQQLNARPIPKDGKTPVLGIDYFVKDGENGKAAPIYPAPKDGQNAVSTQIIREVPTNGLSAYELAIKDGFQGTLTQWLESLKSKGEKGDPADDYDLSCVDGRITKKSATDFFGQPTNIKCESTDD